MSQGAELFRELALQGYARAQSFLGGELALAVRDCGEELRKQGELEAAGVGRRSRNRQAPTVRGDYTTWVVENLEMEPLVLAWRRFERLRRQLNRHLYLGLQRFRAQLAWYPGDGVGYTRHTDAFLGSINRKVTAIVYLNPDWVPEDGGTLVLHDVGDEPVRIEPALDTLVVFMSETIEHEVEPPHAPRWALTAFYRKLDPRFPAL